MVAQGFGINRLPEVNIDFDELPHARKWSLALGILKNRLQVRRYLVASMDHRLCTPASDKGSERQYPKNIK